MIKRYLDTYYDIYDDGRIFNTKLNRFIVQRTDKDGYKVCWMNIGGNRLCVKVHRVVAETFIPNPYNKPQVNHKDLDKSNVCIDNLEWSECDENIRHAFINGAHNNQVSVAKCDDDMNILDTYNSIASASRDIGISEQCINDCIKGKKNKTGGYKWKKV